MAKSTTTTNSISSGMNTRENKKNKRKDLALSTALWVALLWSAKDWVAQEVKVDGKKEPKIELSQKNDTIQGIPADTISFEEASEKARKENSEESQKSFSAFGSVWMANKWYLSASGAVASENPTYSGVVGIRHKSWLWATVVRLDDMTDSPFWRITGVSLSYARKFWLPKDWNFSVTADVMYVDIDNKRNLNAVMPNLALKLGKEIYSVELFALYTAYLNWETPNSAMLKLQWAIQATKTTNVSIRWRWNNANPDLKKQFYWAIWVNQKLPKGFSLWLEWLVKEWKPHIIFGLNKSF